MNPFARFAFFVVARDTGFVTLAAMILMLAFSFEPAWSFEAGATVALIFAIALVGAQSISSPKSAWSAARSGARCRRNSGRRATEGRRWARGYFELLLLHFAKGASGFAGLLYVSALILAWRRAWRRRAPPRTTS